MKHKIFLLKDKLLQANMAASSGLRENVYPVIFIAKMLVYIILFYNYYIVILLAKMLKPMFFFWVDVVTWLA